VKIVVRNARISDAPAMSAVLIASITELCVADHRDDPATLASWLANKTPEGVAKWFGNADTTLVVAEHKGEIAAVGGFNAARQITLNYVSPSHRFVGVSSALLEAMELGLGPGEATLNSTETARKFYKRRGWEEGPVYTGRFIDGYPMRKMLD
jgi:hypothetical protein